MKPFPDVDPDQIELAGHTYQKAAGDLATATTQVKTTAATTSWKSPSARPAWDSTLAARRADIGNAHEVMTHIGNVLRMTGTELSRAQSDYQLAQLTIMYSAPDPRVGHVHLVGGAVVVPDDTPVDPQALAAYMAQVRKANKAVDDAEYVLALCARELMSVSEGVAFAPLPSGSPTAVDPTTNVIIPFAPAFGAPSGAIYANGVPVQFVKGQKFEAQILRELGISDEAKSFFRPDANGNYSLPRTKTGLLRGTFPDSMRAGLLEIKSGSTEITMKMPQIQVQRFIARTLRIPWNIITQRDTPVSPEVVRAVRATGGSVYSRVEGDDSVFYDEVNDEYVRLKGGGGASGRDLVANPVTPEERAQIETTIRNNERLEHNLKGMDDGDEPTLEGPDDPYITEQQYDDAWSKADISPDGDTPLPGAPKDDGPGEPLEGGDPLPAPVDDDPIFPIDPEDFIP